MQGHKNFITKLLYTVNIDTLVSRDNFYCRLHQVLDLRWLYKATEKYYGTEGQASIDSVVFFKICLVGYPNGIYSDRKLIEFYKDSLSVRLFLGYDIDEELPWHSTISRTRHLYGEEEFKTLFEQVFKLCADTGMVSDKTQAIDGAFLKANANTDSLEVKQVSEGVEEHLQQKKIRRSIYTTLLDEAKARQQSVKGQIKKKQRSSTVEPVWGTLLNNLGLRRINSRGVKSANQALLMASACYNLKKYMKRITQKVKIGAIALPKPMGETISFIKLHYTKPKNGF